MASILNATTTSGLVTSADNSGSLQLQTNNGTTAVTIDTNQRLLVGTTTGGRNFVLGGGAGNSIMSFNNDSTGYTIGDGFQIQLSGTNTSIWTYENDYIRFGTNDTERMRITSGGDLLVGTTTMASVTDSSNPSVGGAIGIIGETSGNVLNLKLAGTNGTVVNFARGGIGNVGRIDITTTATSYVTSSDYRLKENIAPMTGALAKVAQLKPCTYTWKSNGSAGQGFIAHELQEVVPDCVSGEKDAVDAEGNPVYQGVDTSFLVATLTAALQEQQAMIEELKQEVQLLKNPPVEGVA